MILWLTTINAAVYKAKIMTIVYHCQLWILNMIHRTSIWLLLSLKSSKLGETNLYMAATIEDRDLRPSATLQRGALEILDLGGLQGLRKCWASCQGDFLIGCANRGWWMAHEWWSSTNSREVGEIATIVHFPGLTSWDQVVQLPVVKFWSCCWLLLITVEYQSISSTIIDKQTKNAIIVDNWWDISRYNQPIVYVIVGKWLLVICCCW